MATTTDTPEITHEAALGCLIERIYAPEFFKKLASLGVEPNNAAESEQLLSLAAMLRGRGYSAQQKTAAAPQGNPWLAELLKKEASLTPLDVKQAAMQCLQHDQQLLSAVQTLDKLMSSAA